MELPLLLLDSPPVGLSMSSSITVDSSDGGVWPVYQDKTRGWVLDCPNFRSKKWCLLYLKDVPTLFNSR